MSTRGGRGWRPPRTVLAQESTRLARAPAPVSRVYVARARSRASSAAPVVVEPPPRRLTRGLTSRSPVPVDERSDRDVAAGPADPIEGNRSGRGGNVGVPIPGGRPGFQASAAWRLCFRAGRGGGAGARAGTAATGAASREIAHARRTGGGVPRPARRRPGDDREAALAAREGGRRLRRPTGRRVCARRRSRPGGSRSRRATGSTPPRRYGRCSRVQCSGG
jgi:hypothetical protein